MRTRTPQRASTSIAYVERVNRAIDHIVSHLAEPLSLKAVSRAALLSPFHFHRVFQALMGETLAEFVKRLRLERALAMMAHAPARAAGSRPARPRLRPRMHRTGAAGSLTQIALACGFSSSSDFSRCFKQRYGASPSRFDIKTWREAHGAELEALVERGQWGREACVKRLPPRHNPDEFSVRIRDLPARTVAYIRVARPYQGDGVVRATQRLLAWAQRHALADGQWLGYQWDNPEITSLEDCRYYVAVEAPPGRFTPSGEIGRFRFPPMVVAQVEIRGPIDLELRALQWLYGTWLPRSGYVPDDHPGFETWIGRPFAHGMEHFELYAQVPVRRA